MPENEKPKCDIDNLMCQMQALNLLEGMKNLFGTEKFQETYPEFQGLSDVVKERMGEQRGTIREIMERCGLNTEEFRKEEAMISEKTPEELQEEPAKS